MSINFIDQYLIHSGQFDFIDVKKDYDEEGRPVLNPEDKIKLRGSGAEYTVAELTDPSASDSFSPCDFTNDIVDRNQPLNTKGLYPRLEGKQIEWKERKAFLEAIESILASPEPGKKLGGFLRAYATTLLVKEIVKSIEMLKAQPSLEFSFLNYISERGPETLVQCGLEGVWSGEDLINCVMNRAAKEIGERILRGIIKRGFFLR